MSIYSHSRISTFENCPLKYKFSYIDKPDIEKITTIEAFLGSRVHDTLEKLYTDKMYEKLLTLKEVLAFYKSEWKKHWSENIKVVRNGYLPENYRLMGVRFLSDYYRRYHPFDQDKTLGLEERVVVKLDGKHLLQGYIDRLALKGDVYEIHDYKTSASLPAQEKLDADRQLALYALAIKRKFKGVENVELVWHYLAFDREMRSLRTDATLEELEKQTAKLIEEIEAATKRNDFPARESGLCKWCAFEEICPKFKHLAKVRQLPLNEYLKEEGVVLVDRFAELERERKETVAKLDAELEKVKEAVFALAAKDGLEVIVGKDHQLKVKVSKKSAFPSTKDAARKDLEELIKENNLWADVSKLDTFALARLVKSGELSKKLLEKIKSFQNFKEEKRLYLSRLK